MRHELFLVERGKQTTDDAATGIRWIMMTGNMLHGRDSLKWNGDQGLRAGLVVLLVTSFISQKAHCILVHVGFYVSVKCFQFLFLLEACGTMQQIYEFGD